MSQPFSEQFRDEIAAVSSALKIETFLEDLGRAPRKRGPELYYLCPWHKEKTPSLALNPITQWFKCHGCQRGGVGILKFAMITYKLNGYWALRKLCAKAKVPFQGSRIEQKEVVDSPVFETCGGVAVESAPPHSSFCPPSLWRVMNGEHNPQGKLRDEDVVIIRTLREQGWRYRKLARKFGVCMDTIRNVVQRRTWKHVP